MLLAHVKYLSINLDGPYFVLLYVFIVFECVLDYVSICALKPSAVFLFEGKQNKNVFYLLVYMLLSVFC